jgi:hypothetical protein
VLYGSGLTLIGNLFYGNKYPIVGGSSYTSSVVSYNVTDVDFGTTSSTSGWEQGEGDVYSTALLVSGKTFKPLSGNPALSVLPSLLPDDYPSRDFYGNDINGGAAAGAAQTIIGGGGSYYLELSTNSSQGGDFTVSPTPDADGLYPSSITPAPLANTESGYVFAYYLVNGIKASAPLTLTGHSRLQTVFHLEVNDFSDESNSQTTVGTLRYALTKAENGDIVFLNGIAGTMEIELKSALAQITKSIVIEGNGVTLTRSSSLTESTKFNLLYLNSSSARVTIRGFHFKEGLASTYGGAIRNAANLTLESCIFNGNKNTTNSTTGSGGAIYNTRVLIIRGCTFYGNTSAYRGGALYTYGSTSAITLTGNLFYNSAGDYPIEYHTSGTVTGSYNVVDVSFGTGTTASGWAVGDGDKTTLEDGDDLTVEGDLFDTTSFVPVAALQTPGILPAVAPQDFPLTDFYGTTRTFPGAPGAVASSPSL